MGEVIELVTAHHRRIQQIKELLLDLRTGRRRAPLDYCMNVPGWVLIENPAAPGYPYNKEPKKKRSSVRSWFLFDPYVKAGQHPAVTGNIGEVRLYLIDEWTPDAEDYISGRIGDQEER